ncbi:UNVERIFIED_CONTAM: hypothetical protein RMT77_012317 [Armadillidium vulgare]
MTFMCSDKSNEANVNINKNKSECTEITDKKQIEILNQSVENKINVKLTEDKHPPKILQNQLNENSKYSKMIFGSYLEKLPFYFAIKRRYIWVRNNFQSIGFILLFLAINFGLFVSRAYEYRHTNVLHIGARACGQCLNFDCALLLGLILRRTITRIRNSSLGVIFPCDRHIHFHKMAGWTVFFFSILHTIFHLANFAGISEETGISLWRYLGDTSLGIGWLWGLANPTGVILFIFLCVIVGFSHRCVRKSGKFEIFYWTHLFSLPFWVLLIIHGPNFWKWLLIPGIIFAMENFIRLAQVCSPRGRTVVVSSYSFGSQVTKLIIRKPRDLDFRAGEYVYLNIPAVAKYEWHPFTISSAPEEEDIFMVHIRAVGGWTEKVNELFHSRNIVEETPSHTECFSIPRREQKISIRGMLNLGFSISQEDICDEDSESTKGRKYHENLKEFNKKMNCSLYSYKIVSEDEKNKKPEGVLERKKSLSLGSLGKCSDKSKSTGHLTPSSGSSSLTGSYSSLHGHSINIQGEPVLFPPVLVLESPNGDRKVISQTDTKNESCKIWIDKSVDSNNSQPFRVNIPNPIEVYVDGPYGSPSSNIFNVNHAVLIGAGIGVTPFASILQSVMHRYRDAKFPCPHCQISSCVSLPSTLRKLRKANFIWVNRDLGHFEWFLELLASLEEEQSIPGTAMEKFLTLHLYKTGKEPLQFPIPLASAIHEGRPDWDKLLSSIRDSRAGKICVYYCGPPTLAAILRERCIYHRLDFRKEMF